MPAATRISSAPVIWKNILRLIFTAPMYMATPMTMEMPTPVIRPAKGTPRDLLKESKTSRAVSMPSRATAMMATVATATGPTATAFSIFPSSSAVMFLLAPFIQMSIQTTRATVTSEAIPPMSSWPVVERVFVPKWMMRKTLTVTTSAAAIPPHNQG